MLLLPKNLPRVSDLAADDGGRLGMTGVHVQVFEDSYRVESTDGKRMQIVRGPSKADAPADKLTAAQLGDAPDDARDGLVPAADWRTAFRSAKKGQGVGVALSSPDVTLATGTQVMRTRQVEGRFPNVDRVLPKRPAMFTVAVNPVLLAELLTALAAIVAEDGGPVQLHFYPGKAAPLGLSCHNAQGQFADALLVSLI